MACMLTCAIPMTHNNEGTESIPVEAIELAVIEEKCKEWVASFEHDVPEGKIFIVGYDMDVRQGNCVSRHPQCSSGGRGIINMYCALKLLQVITLSHIVLSLSFP